MRFDENYTTNTYLYFASNTRVPSFARLPENNGADKLAGWSWGRNESKYEVPWWQPVPRVAGLTSRSPYGCTEGVSNQHFRSRIKQFIRNKCKFNKGVIMLKRIMQLLIQTQWQIFVMIICLLKMIRFNDPIPSGYMFENDAVLCLVIW